MHYFEETLTLFRNSAFYYTICLSMDGTYSYVSPSYDQNFSFTNDTLTGKPFYVTLHPDDIKVCEEVGNNCFQNPGTALPAILRKHDGKGGFIITQWELRAFFDDKNNPAGIFCIGHNVTEYIAAKDELIDVTSKIEKKEELLNEIGFINSHVIRKPLANIIGLTSLLEQMEIGEKLQEIIKMLNKSAVELDLQVKKINSKTV
jgi:PAS domain S-box-containing protein